MLTWTGSLVNVAIGLEVVSLNSTHHGYISTDQDSLPCSNILGNFAEDDRSNSYIVAHYRKETKTLQSISASRAREKHNAQLAS